MRILVTGRNGQVGTALAASLHGLGEVEFTKPYIKPLPARSPATPEVKHE